MPKCSYNFVKSKCQEDQGLGLTAHPPLPGHRVPVLMWGITKKLIFGGRILSIRWSTSWKYVLRVLAKFRFLDPMCWQLTMIQNTHGNVLTCVCNHLSWFGSDIRWMRHPRYPVLHVYVNTACNLVTATSLPTGHCSFRINTFEKLGQEWQWLLYYTEANFQVQACESSNAQKNGESVFKVDLG